jgi:GTP-binding protein HflX
VADVLAAVEADLPRPSIEVKALLPWDRGDLLSRVHDNGEVLSLEHTGEGTRLTARVNEALAGELAAYPA